MECFPVINWEDSMTKIISIVGLSALVASCGGVKSVPTQGVANQQDAARLANNTYTKLQSAGSTAPSRDLTLGSENFTCANGGNGSVTVGIGLSGSDTGSVDETVKFSNCTKTDDYFFDGSVDYKFTANDSGNSATSYSFTVSLNGTIAAIFYNADGSVDQSADVTFNNLAWTMTGTTTATCYTWTATVTGTIKVGDVTYTPTGTDFADTFGGTGTYTSCSKR
jgi:hypothetical protein